MATFKFHFSPNGTSPVKLTFSHGTNKRSRVSLGIPSPTDTENIKPNYIPKNNATKYCVDVLIKVRKLREDLMYEYAKSVERQEEINTLWLQNHINVFFKRNIRENIDKNILVNYIGWYIEKMEKMRIVGKEVISDHKYVLKTLKEYQDQNKIILKLSDIDNNKVNEFINWIRKRDSIMTSTRNRIRKNLKSCISFADKDDETKDLAINAGIIKMEKVPLTEKSDIIYLNFEELGLIKNAEVNSDELSVARDWLIIGCYTGQRVSDFMRMTKDMIKQEFGTDGESFNAIELLQQKTEGTESKLITIPLHYEVDEILEKYDGNFPPLFSKLIGSNESLFNRHIKKLCEIAGIHTIVRAKVYNEKKKYNEIKNIEKCFVVASHVCRRSFASNFYGDKRFATPQIMAITGHKQESVFLNYIGKQSKDHAYETAKVFADLKRKKSAN